VERLHGEPVAAQDTDPVTVARVELDSAVGPAHPVQGALRPQEALLGEPRLLRQSVLLSGLSPTEVQFLTRTTVLDRLSGPLCDAVLGTTGSAAVLASLEPNLLVVPLDRQRA
jgi:hypothetical protein